MGRGDLTVARLDGRIERTSHLIARKFAQTSIPLQLRSEGILVLPYACLDAKRPKQAVEALQAYAQLLYDPRRTTPLEFLPETGFDLRLAPQKITKGPAKTATAGGEGFIDGAAALVRVQNFTKQYTLPFKRTSILVGVHAALSQPKDFGRDNQISGADGAQGNTAEVLTNCRLACENLLT